MKEANRVGIVHARDKGQASASGQPGSVLGCAKHKLVPRGRNGVQKVQFVLVSPLSFHILQILNDRILVRFRLAAAARGAG